MLLAGDGTPTATVPLTGAGDVLSSLSGMSIDLPRGRLAVGLQVSGELRAGDASVTLPSPQGLALVLPLPP